MQGSIFSPKGTTVLRIILNPTGKKHVPTSQTLSLCLSMAVEFLSFYSILLKIIFGTGMLLRYESVQGYCGVKRWNNKTDHCSISQI